MTPSVNTLQQLNDLPSTFKRPGAPYTQLIDSFNAALSRFTNGIDGTLAQTFNTAQYGWLDVWGEIFNIQRVANESDSTYRVRIVLTLLAWVGTVPALEQWGIEMLGAPITVSENVGSVGYSLTLPGTLTNTQVTAFLMSLVRVRPAGVPFTIVQAQIGLYLDTINYLDAYEPVGAYLTDDGSATAPLVAALTNSTVPLLPEFYFQDPTLNPGL
jgi:hypothetical protein